jgi:hypothetical protein
MRKLFGNILIFIITLFLLTSCNRNNGTKFQIVKIIIESKFFNEEGLEISEDEFEEIFGYLPFISIEGGVLNVNKKVYESNADGEIVFEGFGRKTILAIYICPVSYIVNRGILEIRHNNQLIDTYWWWEDPAVSWDPPGVGAYAFHLSLEDEINEIQIILTEENDSYVKLTAFITSISNDD